MRYRLLAETMLQGVVHQDADGQIISMNPAAEMILGKSPDEFLHETSTSVEHHTIRGDGSLFPGDEHPAMVALHTGEVVRQVVMGVYNKFDNDYRWISIDAIPLFQSGLSQPYQVYTVFEDITERKQAEEERERLFNDLQRRLVELDAIFSTIADPMIAYDIDGKVIKSNPKMASLLGCNPIGLHLLEISERMSMRLPTGTRLAENIVPANRALHGEIVIEVLILVTDVAW